MAPITKEKIRKHVVNSTGLLAESIPVLAAFDTGMFGLAESFGLERVPNDVSANAKLFATGLTYAGMGYAFMAGRNLMRRVARIKEKTNEFLQWGVDALYCGALIL